MAVENSFTTGGTPIDTNQRKKIRYDTKNFTYTLPYNYAANDYLGLSLSGVLAQGTI
jgi:hypothetical protein